MPSCRWSGTILEPDEKCTYRRTKFDENRINSCLAGVCAVKMQLAKDSKKVAKAKPARDVEPHDGIVEIIQINSAVR